MSLRNAICLLILAAAATPVSAVEHSADEGMEWSARWVWGTENMARGDGYFRLTFTLPGKPVLGVVQGSGDDGYDLYANGELVHRSAFGFIRTDKADITGRLVAGRNVLAAVCHNAAHPGGWLAELQVILPDGAEKLIVTDTNTRFHHLHVEGWNRVDFDDSAWEKCTEIARPPAGVWGHMPLEFAGKRGMLKLETLEVPNAVEAGQTLGVVADIRAMDRRAEGLRIDARLVRGKSLLGEACGIIPASDAGGETTSRVSIEIPVSPFVRSGAAQLQISAPRHSFVEVGTMETSPVQVSGREGRVDSTPAFVREHNGAPTLVVDGKPMPAMLYLQGRKPVPEEYAQMARAGYRVFSLGLPLGWTGPATYDFTQTDEMILAALRGTPDGYFIPRVAVTAPDWWCDAHPEELLRLGDYTTEYVTDVYGGSKHQSFASELWRIEAGEALRRLIAHIQQSPYADRVIGYHVASGIYGEWHLWSPDRLPDVSEPMRQAFIEWAQRRYDGAMIEINQAWATKMADWDEIRCPMQEHRYESDLGAFKSVGKSRYVPDYWQALHETTVDAINHFCRTVKQATAGEALAGVFYCYATDIGWPQEGGHLAAQKAMESPWIDFFSSPHSYSHRALGQDGAFRAYPASIKVHGKLFIDEGDDRTYLTGNTPYTHVTNVDETIQIMRREVLNVVTNRVGMWWFDMTSGWFNDTALLEEAGRLRGLADAAIQRPAENWADIAAVFDPTTYYTMADWKTGRDALMGPLGNQQFIELQRTGAPYDVLLLDDIFHPGARDYRCYVFINCWHMTAAQRRMLTQRLHRGGKSLIFAYAPGFSGDFGPDLAGMREVTGFDFTMSEGGGSMQATWTEAAGAELGVDARSKWGPDKPMAPRFSPIAESDETLARWNDGHPATASRNQGEWTSVYWGTGPVPARLIAHAAQKAGTHIWCEAWEKEANFYAGNGICGLHTAQEGRYEIRLPMTCRVTDALSGETILKSGDVIRSQIPEHTTVVYRIEAAD